MEDIRLAVGLMAFLSVATFGITFRLLRHRRKIWLDVVAVVTVALLLVYVYRVWGQLWIVTYIPLPSVIILSNWFPPLLGVLAAIAWLRFDPPPGPAGDGAEGTLLLPDANPRGAFDVWGLVRRLPAQIVLLGAAVYSMMYFIPKAPPVCGDKWNPPFPPMVFPVCMQTTPHTCSAASAATILTTLGEETSEQEMAQMCLTKSGTTWLGLYHGLSWKLLGTGFRVEFFEGGGAELTQHAARHPVLLCCQLTHEVARQMPEYRQAGWNPGTAHSVVYFGTLRDRHVIGDPAVGYELWTDKDLNALWTGQGLRIARVRNSPLAATDQQDGSL